LTYYSMIWGKTFINVQVHALIASKFCLDKGVRKP